MLCFVRICPTFDCVNSVEDMPYRFILFDIELNNINKRRVSSNFNNYKENNKSVGASIGLGSNKAVSGSASIGKIDSKYENVTNQSGIYAGKEGFDIRVEDNTDLKGGIIFSEAEKDKNKISTGTLTYEDIKNKAEYEAGSTGINVDTSAGAEKKDAGVTPNIGVGAKDDAESVTKATVSEGEIEIRDKKNQKQDLKDLNRDTQKQP